MPVYTEHLGLYKPSRVDNLALDTTMADNMQKIDDGIKGFTSGLQSLEDRFTDEVSAINGLTTKNVSLYVDANSGDDNNDGSEASPFKTIQKAIDSIPKIINRDRFIYIADGTYDEEVVVKSINGGAIVLTRKGGLVDVTTGARPGVLLRSIVFYDISGLCRVENLDSYRASTITGEGFVRFSRCGYGTVNSCRGADSSITTPTFIFDGTPGSVNSCYLNSQSICVLSMNASSVRADSTNEHGSTNSGVALQAQAGEIRVNGTAQWTAKASTPEKQLQGGRIRRQLVDPIELATSGAWTAYPGGNYKPRAVKDEAGTVHLQGAIQSGTPAQGTTVIQLPVGYRPLYNNHIFGTYSNDGTISKIVVDIGGSLAVERSTGSYVSLSGISFYAGS